MPEPRHLRQRLACVENAIAAADIAADQHRSLLEFLISRHRDVEHAWARLDDAEKRLQRLMTRRGHLLGLEAGERQPGGW
jgi:phosphate uptake regulator